MRCTVCACRTSIGLSRCRTLSVAQPGLLLYLCGSEVGKGPGETELHSPSRARQALTYWEHFHERGCDRNRVRVVGVLKNTGDVGGGSKSEDENWFCWLF